MPRDLEWRQKLSELAKKRGTAHLQTPEVRAKRAQSLKGKSIPIEVRQNKARLERDYLLRANSSIGIKAKEGYRMVSEAREILIGKVEGTNIKVVF